MGGITDIFSYCYHSINDIEINTLNSVYRLVLSMVLGAVVGYERKRRGQPAGVRTFSLIAMGAALAMILSIYVPQAYLGLKNGDPGRIAAQVVTGVGFLGAGAIMQMKGSVRGLTTAAGIWMIAAIGMTVGVGLYWVSIIATLLILFILVQLESIEHRINTGAESRIIRIRVGEILTDISDYRHVLHKNRITLMNFYVEYDYEIEETRLNLVILSPENIDYIGLFKQFEGLYKTKSITLANQINI
jgi:putative Mg2+ transporter-C (MgtC) family protein